jgi:hypothetical protein
MCGVCVCGVRVCGVCVWCGVGVCGVCVYVVRWSGVNNTPLYCFLSF